MVIGMLMALECPNGCCNFSLIDSFIHFVVQHLVPGGVSGESFIRASYRLVFFLVWWMSGFHSKISVLIQFGVVANVIMSFF